MRSEIARVNGKDREMCPLLNISRMHTYIVLIVVKAIGELASEKYKLQQQLQSNKQIKKTKIYYTRTKAKLEIKPTKSANLFISLDCEIYVYRINFLLISMNNLFRRLFSPTICFVFSMWIQDRRKNTTATASFIQAAEFTWPATHKQFTIFKWIFHFLSILFFIHFAHIMDLVFVCFVVVVAVLLFGDDDVSCVIFIAHVFALVVLFFPTSLPSIKIIWHGRLQWHRFDWISHGCECMWFIQSEAKKSETQIIFLLRSHEFLTQSSHIRSLAQTSSEMGVKHHDNAENWLESACFCLRLTIECVMLWWRFLFVLYIRAQTQHTVCILENLNVMCIMDHMACTWMRVRAFHDGVMIFIEHTQTLYMFVSCSINKSHSR